MRSAFGIGGEVWHIMTVPAGDPRLIDRTGTATIATTDHATRTICIMDSVRPPLLDRVLLHEMAHAVAMSRGLLPAPVDRVGVEEWAAGMVESHGIEMVGLASEVLGRPVCVEGWCHGQPRRHRA